MLCESEPVRITSNFYRLGPAAVPSFLLDGEHPRNV
jgi:hypothetical protein